jgi:periplasmic copper chaperone A
MKKIFLLLSALSSIAWAQHHPEFKVAELKVSHAYTYASPPGAKVGAAFFTLSNGGKGADKLLSAQSSVAGKTEIHTMEMAGGMMKMRAIPSLDIAPNQSVELKPGGYHIMLFELKQGLEVGKTFPITLTFEKAGKLEISIAVESRSATGAGHANHKH